MNYSTKRTFWGKEAEEEMLVRLYAGEIILGKIQLTDVPAKLQDEVAAYLKDMSING